MLQERINWLRTLTLDTVVEQVCQALHEGVSEDDLWAAVTLTATRYINNQAHNLLGFVSHAMIACEDARRLAVNQPAPIRHLLLIQALYQVVFDLNDPCLTPFELLPCKPLHEKTTADNIRWLRTDVRMGEYLRCDHRIVGLEQTLPRAELLDVLLDVAMEGMVTDDHTLISPVLCLGLSELVGWENGFDMLRCTLRYSASFPRNFAPYDRALKLRQQYGLENGAKSSALQPERIQALREAFLTAQPVQRPEIAARAMAEEGYSPATVLAAVTLTGADFYLMAEPVPHEDFDAISREVAPMHIGTSTNALRDGLKYMSPGTQALAAIQGGSILERGPSVLNKDFEFVPFEPRRPYPYAEDIVRLAKHTPQELLPILRQTLHDHDYNTSTAAVRNYADQQGDPDALIALLIEVACTDDGTLMHSVKHLNSMVEEFTSSTHPDRWNFLIAATRFMTWYAGLNTNAYQRAAQPVSA